MLFFNKLNFEKNKEYWINIFFLFTGFLLSLGMYWTYDIKVFLYFGQILILLTAIMLMGKDYIFLHRKGIVGSCLIIILFYSCGSSSSNHSEKAKGTQKSEITTSR